MITNVFEFILTASPAWVATFAVGFVLWFFGVADPFMLTFLALLFGGVPVLLIEWKFIWSKRTRRSAGTTSLTRPPESSHPSER